MTGNSRRRFLVAAGGVAVAASLRAFAANGTPPGRQAVINKSGRMRMLSQRILKAYAQVGLGLMQNESLNILGRSVMQANGSVVDLRAAATAETLKAQLAKVEKTWAAFRDLATVAPAKNEAKLVARLGDELLVEADRLTGLFEAAAGGETAAVVNLAGRQRMLSQRMARYYFYAAWGVGESADKAAFEKARADFSGALAMLKAFPQNSGDIRHRLAMLGDQWDFMLAACTAGKWGGYSPAEARQVATTSERILEIADELTGLYADLR